MQQLASGSVPVSYESLPGGFKGTDETVKRMQQAAMGRYGARSPKIRALARNIIVAAGVPEKDYQGEAIALGKWVQNNIRYMKDVYGQETLSYPEETAFNMKAGDCLDKDTLLLTSTGYKTIQNVNVGEMIMGKKGWTKVTNKWDKGEIESYEIHLNNGGGFIATADHKCFLKDGESEIKVSDLKTKDELLTLKRMQEFKEFPEKFSLTDCKFIGLLLADGWIDKTKNQISISGKDNHPKEQQKVWVRDYADAKGWTWYWNERYIGIKMPQDDIIWKLFSSCGTAVKKAIPDEVMEDLSVETASALLEGLLSDSYDPENIFTTHTELSGQRRGGLCVSTISDRLAIQIRTLFRMQGISVRDTLVVKHGGLGKNPIHRIYPRMYRDKPVTVIGIEPCGRRHVYDISTEDHGIYIPKADVVVHNCDDKSTLLASLLGAVGIPSRFKVIGVTPFKYSHVYLQAKPKDRWITMDTIMRDKPIGWEVPQGRRAIEKTYPINGIEGIGATGGNMSGLGYVGDPRTVSHLEEPSIPYGAGTGARGPKPVHRPNYVKMASMLDTDAPIDPMMAFPPNQNIPQKYPQQRAQSIAPEMQRLGPEGIHGEDETETMAFDGRHEVIGPDELANIEGKRPPENMTVPAYMQTKTVVQRPEGVDAMFGRPSMVLDPNKGDKVEYYGRYSLAEKPPIRPYENIAGEEDNTLQVPTARPQPRTGVMLAAVAAGLAALWYFKRK